MTIESDYEAAWAAHLEETGNWTSLPTGSGPSYRCELASGEVFVRQTLINVTIRR